MQSSFKNHVLYLVNTLTYGGAETQVFRLAKAFRQRSWEVTVVSMTAPDAYVGELDEAGIRTISLHMTAGIPDPRGLVRFLKVLSRLKPAIVHSHILHANLLARAAMRARKLLTNTETIPLLCTAHNTIEGGKMWEVAYRCTDGWCDMTTNVSRAAVNRYIERKMVSNGRIAYVPNGIEVARYDGGKEERGRIRRELTISEGECVWLAVGRLHEAKDYPNLLNAFRKLKKVAPKVRLLICGKGSLEVKLKGMAEDMKLVESVKFLGTRVDVPALMAAADAYVMSSAWEGLPLVLQEACAMRLPVVATDVGGNAEIISNGVSGFLVPPANHEALAARMLEVSNMDCVTREQMGAAGRTHIEKHYAMEVVVDEWERIYAHLGGSTMREGCD